MERQPIHGWAKARDKAANSKAKECGVHGIGDDVCTNENSCELLTLSANTHSSPPPPVEFADFYARRGKYFAGIGRVTTVEKPGGVSRMIRRETKSSLRGSKRHFSPARIPLYPFLLFILVSSSVYAVGRRERIPIFTIIKSRI